MRLKVTKAQWRAKFQNQAAFDIIFKLWGCVKSFCLNDENNCSCKTICLSGLAWRLFSNYIIILVGIVFVLCDRPSLRPPPVVGVSMDICLTVAHTAVQNDIPPVTFSLRWLKTVSSTNISMGHCNHSLSLW